MNRFSNFAEELNKISSFEVVSKGTSPLMNLLSKILFFVDFDKYSTTLFNKIYLKESSNENDSIITIAHEFKHILDFKNKFNNILYLFPQILIILVIPLVFISWWFLFCLLFLLPLPAFFRKNFELNAYKVSLFTLNEILLENKFNINKRIFLLHSYAENINFNFINANYYFMWPFGVEKDLQKAIDLIIKDEIIENNDIYSIVRSALVATKV